MNRKTKIAALVSAGALAAAGAGIGVAQAAIPDSNGEITLCAWDQPSYQILHVVQPDAGYTCPTGYKIFKIKQNGVPGPAGPAGPKGDKGDPGDSGSLATIQVTGSDSTGVQVGNEGPNIIYGYNPIAQCPSGYVVTGGGADSADTVHTLRGRADGPTADGTGWQSHDVTSGNANDTWTITAICALGTTS